MEKNAVCQCQKNRAEGQAMLPAQPAKGCDCTPNCSCDVACLCGGDAWCSEGCRCA